MSLRDRFVVSDRDKRLFEQERVLVQISESIRQILNDEGISQRELAVRMGTSEANISKLLREDNNFKLRTLVNLFYALGRSIRFSLGPVGQPVSPIPDSERVGGPLAFAKSGQQTFSVNAAKSAASIPIEWNSRRNFGRPVFMASMETSVLPTNHSRAAG